MCVAFGFGFKACWSAKYACHGQVGYMVFFLYLGSLIIDMAQKQQQHAQPNG